MKKLSIPPTVIQFPCYLIEVVMHESIPGVTIPPREHTRELDLIGYDSANARVPGHN